MKSTIQIKSTMSCLRCL